MKTIAKLLLLAGLSASFAATAATNITSGSVIDNTACVLLGDNVTLNLSKSVSGAYSCDETSSTIKVATCHATGSRKPTQVACASTTDATTGEAVWNDASCDGTANQTFEIADYRAFAASSQGGSVMTVNLGGNCTDGTVAGLGDYLD